MILRTISETESPVFSDSSLKSRVSFSVKLSRSFVIVFFLLGMDPPCIYKEY